MPNIRRTEGSEDSLEQQRLNMLSDLGWETQPAAEIANELERSERLVQERQRQEEEEFRARERDTLDSRQIEATNAATLASELSSRDAEVSQINAPQISDFAEDNGNSPNSSNLFNPDLLANAISIVAPISSIIVSDNYHEEESSPSSPASTPIVNNINPGGLNR
jgi:hypothetical protein